MCTDWKNGATLDGEVADLQKAVKSAGLGWTDYQIGVLIGAAVIFGHSHIPLHEQDDGFQIFNPGSPTDRRRQPRHTMGIAHSDGGRGTFEHLALD